VTGPESVDAARAVAPCCDAVLLDSRTSDRLGGTGRPHDWSISAAIVDALAWFDRPVVLAGGLTPATVAAAIRQVRPYAVDVNSGVETAGGDKDPAACAAFVAAARSTP
jgi:phosphoribosylanthranilate isomerase